MNGNSNVHQFFPTSSNSKSSTKDLNCVVRKRRHNADNDPTDFKLPQPKAIKLAASASTLVSRMEFSPILTAAEEEIVDGSFDSSTGASFDDVLGMLDMPVKNSKKSFKSPSTPTGRASTINKKDSPTLSKDSNSSTSTKTIAKTNTKRIAHTSKSIMDCDFNNNNTSTSYSTMKPVCTLNNTEILTHDISSKPIKTKIYSGVRTGRTLQVSSLANMCTTILHKNIDTLKYTGGVPFDVLRPVLDRLTTQQLYVFEEHNPSIMVDSDVLWQHHVYRNYRTKNRQENESWREMFLRCKEEEEHRLSILNDRIKASQDIAAAAITKTQIAFANSMVKPPPNILKKQAQFGTKDKVVTTPAARVRSLSSITPNAAKPGDKRLKVSSNARDHGQASSSTNRRKKAPLMKKTLQYIRCIYKR